MIIAFVAFSRILSSDWHLQSDERYTSKFTDVIDENYETIMDAGQFTKIIKPYLRKTNSILFIVDKDGDLKFSSNQDDILREFILSNDIKDINNTDYINNIYIITKPIIKNNSIVATAYIVKNKDNLVKLKYQNLLILLIYIIGFLLMLVLMLMYLRRFTSSFIKTINELKNAAENIAIENFEFDVQAYSDDELGDFCVYFNQMKDKLNDSLIEKEAYEQNRKDMIVAISHDLRTPLTTIKTYVEGLQCHMADTPERVEKYLNIIQNKVSRLDRLIDDLFVYSQCQIGKYEIKKENCDSVSFYNELQLEYECDDTDKRIRFESIGDLNTIHVNIDKERIKQVIDNLISNALYYSKDKADIEVGINHSEELILFIRDHGIGIEEEDLPYVFDRFYRCDKSRLSTHGGMGLGLAICKYIIEAHKGVISVSSKKDLGTTFYIRLPIS